MKFKPFKKLDELPKDGKLYLVRGKDKDGEDAIIAVRWRNYDITNDDGSHGNVVYWSPSKTPLFRETDGDIVTKEYEHFYASLDDIE